MRILHIEDDVMLARTVELTFRANGFDVDRERDGTAGVASALTKTHSAIVLELELPSPELSGMQVIKRVRAAAVDTPILVLSRMDEVALKVAALTNGADDYLVKPFHKDELMARVYALIRRSHGAAESVITLGDLAYDLTRKSLRSGTHLVTLTRTEQNMFELLLERRGALVTKQEFLAHLYAEQPTAGINIVDVYICKLRKKLRNAHSATLVENMWGRGYRLKEPEPAPCA